MLEYHTEHINAIDDKHLNELGQQGWQLIAIYDDIAYFLRPVPLFDRLSTKDQVVITEDTFYIPMMEDEWKKN